MRRMIRKGAGTERPQGGHSYRGSAWGGGCPPQRKTRTSRTLTKNVRTCCCMDSMETSRIIAMGRTWKEESRTTLSDSAIGAR